MKAYKKPIIEKSEQKAGEVSTACTCSGCTTHIELN